jgi:hypothetical protein
MTLVERVKSINWLGIIGVIIPTIILAGGILLYVSDRLETDKQKRVRIADMLAPLVEVVESNTESITDLTGVVRDHDHRDGHAPMVARVTALERQFEQNHLVLLQIQEDIKSLLRAQQRRGP